MKLRILSDLHIEFADFAPPGVDCDVVILAGDIGVGMGGLRWAESRFPDRPVVYVLGNHEFYFHDTALVGVMKARGPTNIHVLNNDQVVIDGVRFLGSTLWTDFALFGEAERRFAMETAQLDMPDFSVIQNDGQTFTPEDAMEMHRSSREWLETMLTTPFDGSTVVVTHHGPSFRSVHPRYADNPLTPAFASHLDHLIAGDRMSLWVHGHMHDPFDYELNGTRVVCNPRGYAPYDLTSAFRPDLVVEI